VSVYVTLPCVSIRLSVPSIDSQYAAVTRSWFAAALAPELSRGQCHAESRGMRLNTDFLSGATSTCILLCANRFRALLGLDQVKACFSIRLSVTGLADFAFLLVVTRPLVGIRVTEVVCLSVVVSACKHISGTTRPVSTKLPYYYYSRGCYLWPWLDPPLTELR